MRVLLAPDCFTGTLTATQAAEAMRAGWAEQAPHDTLVTCPLSDGGPGFVDTLAGTLGGSLEAVTVTGPLGTPVPAQLLRVGETAYVETAQACGLHLVPDDRRDPGATTTAAWASWSRPRSTAAPPASSSGSAARAPTTAGPGCWPRWAPATPRRSAAAGSGSPTSHPERSPACPPSARRLRGTRLVVATDVDVPLLGLQGASAGFAAQKGATPEQAQRLEAALGHFADLAVRALGDDARPDLLSGAGSAAGARRRLTQAPGAGAAGGLGFGLMLLGGHRVPGSAAVLDAVRFDDRLAETDLVVTGEGSFDWRSLRGKVVSAVAERALAVGVPTIVVAGRVEAGRREATAAGIESSYAVAETDEELRASLADPGGTLAARVRRVARTWSPRPR